MADFSVVKQAAAPRRPANAPNRLNSRMAQYEGYVASLKKGEVGRLAPDTNETARELLPRVTRAGQRISRPVEAWTVDRRTVLGSPIPVCRGR